MIAVRALEQLCSLEVGTTLVVMSLLTLWYHIRYVKSTWRLTANSSGSASPKYTTTDHESTPGTEAHGLDDSAAVCWQRRDGKYKHCALLAGGIKSGPPPRYSLADLDLPMPELLDGEREGLEALSRSLADVPSGRRDGATLIRFLRARKGDVHKAADYYRQARRYRDSIDLDGVDERWNLEVFERCFAPWWARGGVVGHSHEGGIVGWERFGRCGLADVIEHVPWEVLQKLDAVHMVRVLAAFEEDSMRRRDWLGKAILVLDLEGLRWKDCSRKAIRTYGKLVEARDMLMPNTLKHIFLIMAPRWISTAWDFAKYVLDPQTRAKVEIVSGQSQSLDVLRRYMPDAAIPAYIGGGLRPEGDPECRLILGSPGRLPLEAVERLLELQRHVSERGGGIPRREEKGLGKVGWCCVCR